MLERAGGRAGRFLEMGLIWVWATTGGCAGGDDPRRSRWRETAWWVDRPRFAA